MQGYCFPDTQVGLFRTANTEKGEKETSTSGLDICGLSRFVLFSFAFFSFNIKQAWHSNHVSHLSPDLERVGQVNLRTNALIDALTCKTIYMLVSKRDAWDYAYLG